MKITVAISGASGSNLGVNFVKKLPKEVEVFVIFSKSAKTALKLENEGYGYVLQSIGLLSGEMPYTTFYARKSYIENNKEIIKSFTKAINKGLEFVKNNDEMKIAKSIYKQFPDLSLNDLSTIVKRYKDADSFLDSSYIEEKLLVNLENLLIDNNLLRDYVPYNDLIIEVK